MAAIALNSVDLQTTLRAARSLLSKRAMNMATYAKWQSEEGWLGS